ncbi:Serine/threonine-protein phosphatase 5 [Vitis vinifera]|uniref:protein-serine/threonine phosphatase n=1 Tax=Vitis vinifera TaxID=29760 RepID=A0A438IPM0_VITVI|nr:Serine/threonine-protein phosphatase 5 [Vitis vinifera]
MGNHLYFRVRLELDSVNFHGWVAIRTQNYPIFLGLINFGIGAGLRISSSSWVAALMLDLLFLLIFIVIGTGPDSSSLTTLVTALAAAAVAMVVVMLVVGIAATAVATTVVAVVVVVIGACWWGGCTSGVFSKSHTVNLDVEPQYSGARIEGDVVTLDFVKRMLDDFKNQKCLHKRYAFQIVLQTREMLRALPSLVDINVPNNSHFTVCGDVHGQVIALLSPSITFL